MTKKIVFLMCMLATLFCEAQENSSVALSYGLGKGSFGSVLKSGSGFNTEQKSLNVFGVNYWHGIGKNLFFETGMQLIRYEYKRTSAFSNIAPILENLDLISVPFKLRFEAGKYFFFNGGLTADISKSSDIKGVGAGVGVGVQFEIHDKLSLYANPQLNVHGIIPRFFLFSNSNVTFGVSYQISKP